MAASEDVSLDLVAECSLIRCLKASGCCDWSSLNEVAIGTNEGTVVATFVVKKKQDGQEVKATVSCQPIKLKSSPVEPQGLDRKRLIEELHGKHLDAFSMRLDTVLCPGLRSMGDMLFIKQVAYEPQCVNRHPYVAVLAQELTIYRFYRHRWQEMLVVNHILSSYLDMNPVANTESNCDQKFNTYMRQIIRACWINDISQDSSYLVFINAYGFIFCLPFADSKNCSVEPAPADLVKLSHAPANTSPTTSVCWVKLTHSAASPAVAAGGLCIGRANGTCTVTLVSKELSVHSNLELLAEADADYQQVEHLRCIQEDTVIFSKNKTVYIYSFINKTHRQYHVTESKYSIKHTNADSTFVYICTADKGVIIKARATGDTVHSITDSVNQVSVGACISSNSHLLLTLTQPSMYDLYRFTKPLQLKAYSLKPFSHVLTSLWEDTSANACLSWDARLLIELKCLEYPEWFLELINRPPQWNSLRKHQLQLLHVALTSLAKHQNKENEEYKEKRFLVEIYLVMLHIQSLSNQQTPAIQRLLHSCRIAVELTSWDDSNYPTYKCPACSDVQRLAPVGLYRCVSGHSVEVCKLTLTPVLDSEYAVCIKGCTLINRVEAVDGSLRPCIADNAVCTVCDAAFTNHHL